MFSSSGRQAVRIAMTDKIQNDQQQPMQKQVVDLTSWLTYQKEHDEAYHRDVLWLNPDVRAKHYVLQFSQHMGRLVHIRQNYGEGEWYKVMADIMITALSAINTWPLSSQVFVGEYLEVAIQERVRAYLEQRKVLSLAFLPWVQEELALVTGRMARVCTQLDQRKTEGYRETIEEGLVEIIILVLAVVRMLNIDLSHILQMRWQEIEQSTQRL